MSTTRESSPQSLRRQRPTSRRGNTQTPTDLHRRPTEVNGSGIFHHRLNPSLTTKLRVTTDILSIAHVSGCSGSAILNLALGQAGVYVCRSIAHYTLTVVDEDIIIRRWSLPSTCDIFRPRALDLCQQPDRSPCQMHHDLPFYSSSNISAMPPFLRVKLAAGLRLG